MLIIVFPDKSTYSPAAGCRLVEVPENLDMEDVEQALEDENYQTVYAFTGRERDPKLFQGLESASGESDPPQSI